MNAKTTEKIPYRIMRVKVIFDSRLRLGEYSKVVVPIPNNVEFVQDLVEHLRDTFGLNEADTGRITVSIDDFVITNNQLVKDVLVNDDMIRIRCERTPDVRSPVGSVTMQSVGDDFVMVERPIKRLREFVKSESPPSPKFQRAEDDLPPSTGKVYQHVEDKVADLPSLAVIDESVMHDGPGIVQHQEHSESDDVQEAENILHKTASTDALRESVKSESSSSATIQHAVDDISAPQEMPPQPEEEESPDLPTFTVLEESSMHDVPAIIIGQAPAESDSMPPESGSPASSPAFMIHPSAPIEPSALKLEGPDTEHVQRSDEWRDRQKKKSITALRRQLEWFVKQDGPLTPESLLSQPRVADLADSAADILEAVARSDKLRFVSESNTVELKVD